VHREGRGGHSTEQQQQAAGSRQQPTDAAAALRTHQHGRHCLLALPLARLPMLLLHQRRRPVAAAGVELRAGRLHQRRGAGPAVLVPVVAGAVLQLWAAAHGPAGCAAVRVPLVKHAIGCPIAVPGRGVAIGGGRHVWQVHAAAVHGGGADAAVRQPGPHAARAARRAWHRHAGHGAKAPVQRRLRHRQRVLVTQLRRRRVHALPVAPEAPSTAQPPGAARAKARARRRALPRQLQHLRRRHVLQDLLQQGGRCQLPAFLLAAPAAHAHLRQRRSTQQGQRAGLQVLEVRHRTGCRRGRSWQQHSRLPQLGSAPGRSRRRRLRTW
jgi:hypothetical protein